MKIIFSNTPQSESEASTFENNNFEYASVRVGGIHKSVSKASAFEKNIFEHAKIRVRGIDI